MKPARSPPWPLAPRAGRRRRRRTAQQGVSKTEIVIGTIQDLSGPLAGFGKQIRNGMQLRVDEINEQGGIHGRKIKLIVEDRPTTRKKAVLAAQKLVNQDKIFAMVGHIGTAQNNAAMPIQFEKNVINFLPVTAAREMYEPFHKLKFAFAATYYDQMRRALPKMVKEKGAKKVCVIYQDDEFGLEVLRGAEAGLKTIGMELAEKTTLQARRHRLLVAGGAHEGRRLRPGRAGHHHPRDHRHHRRVAQDRLQPDLPRLQRGLHRPDPQARRQGDGRPVRDHDAANPYTRRCVAAGALLGQQVQDQVQRGPDRVLGLRLPDRRHLRNGRARRPAPT